MIFKLKEFFYHLYTRVFYNAGRNVFISRKAEIRDRKFVTLGSNTRILKNAKLDTSTNPSSPDYRKNTRTGRITIGSGCKIKEYVLLTSYDGTIEIGDNCTINPFTIIYGHGGVTIGNNVMIAAHTIVVSSNHRFENVDISMRSQGIERKGIVVEDNVWIGAGVKILDGVTIGNGVIIAAGSVVTTSLEAFGIYGGVPAKLIRKRTDDI